MVSAVPGEDLTAGVIVETEAYDGEADLASHARVGRTARTATMYGPGGHAYVYLIYGVHTCLNVVAGPSGRPGAVLVRAIEPGLGVELMRARRARAHDRDERLAAGPGRVTEALAIDRSLDGIDLAHPGRLWLAAPPAEAARELGRVGIVEGARVGVAYAGPVWAEMPWRFGWRGHRSLSRPFERG